MRKLLLLLILVVGLTGCAGIGSKVSPEETIAKYGPLPNNWQELVSVCISRKLIDPESARFSWHEAQPRSNGWYGGVWVNAKNRLGGYVGDKPWEWLIVNGQVTDCNQHVLGAMLR